VLLARIDPISSVADSSFRRKLRDLLLGPERINPLADPRLEALRCFAVALAHDRDEMADREEARLIALNFTPARSAMPARWPSPAAPPCPDPDRGRPEKGGNNPALPNRLSPNPTG
jgi:hypothetical protein